MQLSELPALRVAFLLGAGILTAQEWRPDGMLLSFLVLFTGLLLGFHLVDSFRSDPHPVKATIGSRYIRVTEWSWLMVIYLLGASLMGIHQRSKAEESRRHEWTQWAFAEDLFVQGTISALQESGAGSPEKTTPEKMTRDKTTLEIRIDSLGFPSNTPMEDLEGDLPPMTWFKTAGRFTLQSPEGNRTHTPSLRSGQVIKARVRLYPAQENHNPGGFNYHGWLKKRGLYLQGVVLSYEISDALSGYSILKTQDVSAPVPAQSPDAITIISSISRLRDGILHRIETHFTAETAPFLKAFLLGDKSSLDSAAKEAFSRAGLSHIMAVSGLHVGFLLTPFWMLLPMLRRWNSGPVIGLTGLISFLWIYASLTGFSTSVNRASLMAVLLGYGSLYSKGRSALNQMSVAATGLLLISPAELLEPGFQLSFGAVTLLLLWMPSVQPFIERTIRNRFLSAMIQVMSVTLVVQTGLTPILAFWFGEISLIAPISNLLVVPLLSFLMPAAIVLLGMAPLLEFIPWIFQPIIRIVEWILLVSEQAGQEGLSLSLKKPSLTIILAWIGLLCAALPSISARFRWKLFRLVLGVLFIGGVVNMTDDLKPKPFRMVVLDVGQGDAIFFQTPTGKHYLVDTGTWSPGWNSGKGVLIPFLKEENILRIHGLFLTHPHADHVGGAAEILSTVQIDTVYRPAFRYESELNRQLDRVILQNGIPERNPVAGESFLLGGEIQVYVLNPERHAADMQNVNNASLVMKWVYGEVAFMLTGDAEAGVEQEIVDRFTTESGHWLRADVLKVAHHGSKTSTTAPFMEAVSPTIALVPLAFRNRYRHPHKEVTERLISTTGSEENVYFTSLDGPLILFCDSKKIQKIESLKER